MSELEHYFENLLYNGHDVKGDWNKNSLSKEQQKAVETCARYVIYTLFETRERFENWCKEEKQTDMCGARMRKGEQE